MAIGHSGGAFATVEAPKVDFGEIALNAQKFQAQDQEMIKSLIPKEKEVKPYEFTPQKVTETSGLNFFNTSLISKLGSDSAELMVLDQANKKGQLPPDQVARYTELMNGGANVSATLKAVGGIYSEYTKGVANQSGAFKSTADYLKGYTENNGQNVIVTTDKQTGVPYFQQPLIVDGKPVIDEVTGKPKVKTFIDRKGVERDGLAYSQILSGDAFTPINKFDMLANSGKIISQIKLKETGSDTGVIKNIQSVITGENKTAIESYIKTTMLDNNDVLADTLYSIDPVKYANPKSSYSAEEKELVAAEGRKQIYGGLGVKNVTDVNLDSRNKQEDKEKLKASLGLPQPEFFKFMSPEIKDREQGFVTLKDTKNIQKKYTITGLDGNTISINTDSKLLGGTFDENGRPVISITVPKIKSSTYAKEQESLVQQMMAARQAGDEETATKLELQLKSQTTGGEYETLSGFVSEQTMNDLLANSSIPNWDAFKYKIRNAQPKTTGIGGKYNKIIKK